MGAVGLLAGVSLFDVLPPSCTNNSLSCFLHAQDGSVSVWRRTPNQLTYSLLGMHKLVPPPSRINNNATISLLCTAASAWVRPALLPQSPMVTYRVVVRDFKNATADRKSIGVSAKSCTLKGFLSSWGRIVYTRQQRHHQ